MTSDADGTVAIGYQSLLNLITGQYNTAIGQGALSTLTTQSYNVAIGRGSLGAVAANYNLGLGNNAGDNITTGSGNVLIGHYVDPSYYPGFIVWCVFYRVIFSRIWGGWIRKH